MMEERCIYHIQSKKNIHCQIYHNSGLRNPLVLLESVQCLDLTPLPKVLWDGKDDLGKAVPSGIYCYRLEAGDFTGMRKMVVMR